MVEKIHRYYEYKTNNCFKMYNYNNIMTRPLWLIGDDVQKVQVDIW